MTSTSFNVGLNPNSRNSSKVLRPPGGGHTDIFGIQNSGNDVFTPSKRKNVPPTTIRSCFTQDEEKNVKETDSQVNGGNTHEKGTEENKAPEQHSPPRQNIASKGRVPPGGFSSGFW